MKLLGCISLTLLAASFTVQAKPALNRYRGTYQLAGFILRSAAVCPAEQKHAVDIAFALLELGEYKAMSQAFPATIEGWMKEGSGRLNDSVMNVGLSRACNEAYAARAKAAAAVQR